MSIADYTELLNQWKHLFECAPGLAVWFAQRVVKV